MRFEFQKFFEMNFNGVHLGYYEDIFYNPKPVIANKSYFHAYFKTVNGNIPCIAIKAKKESTYCIIVDAIKKLFGLPVTGYHLINTNYSPKKIDPSEKWILSDGTSNMGFRRMKQTYLLFQSNKVYNPGVIQYPKGSKEYHIIQKFLVFKEIVACKKFSLKHMFLREGTINSIELESTLFQDNTFLDNCVESKEVNYYLNYRDRSTVFKEMTKNINFDLLRRDIQEIINLYDESWICLLDEIFERLRNF